jgi:hypothetical protein
MGNLAPRSRRVFALEHLKSQYRQVIDKSLSEDNLVYKVLRDIITDYCGYETILQDFLNNDMPVTLEMVDLLPTLLQWDLDPRVMTPDAKVPVDSPAILRSDIVKPQLGDVRAYREISLGPGKIAGNDGGPQWTSTKTLFIVLPFAIRQNSIFLVNAMWPSSDAFSFRGEWCPIRRNYLVHGPEEKQFDQFLLSGLGDFADWGKFCDSAPRRMATWEHAFRLASNDFSDLETLHVIRYISTAINAFWAVPSRPWKRAFDIFSYLSFDQKTRMFPSGRITLDDIVEVDDRYKPWAITKLAGISKSITKSIQKRKALIQEVDDLMKEPVDETMDEASDTETLLSFRNRVKSHVEEHRIVKKPKAVSSKSK